MRDQSARHGSVSNMTRNFASNIGDNASRPTGRRHENTDPSSSKIDNQAQGVDSPWKARATDGPDSRLGKDSNAIATGDSPSTWGTGHAAALGGSALGAFGLFGASALANAGEKRPSMSAGRPESRFKGLMSRDINQDDHASLSPVNSRSASVWRMQGAPEENDPLQGSAALNGGHDSSFSRFGQGSLDDADGLDLALKPKADHTRSDHLHTFNSAMSPTNTDPYDQSDPLEHDADGNGRASKLPGLGPVSATVGGVQSSAPFAAFGQHPDRSQNSSVSQQRPFGGFSGFGGLPGLGSSSAWGSTHGTAASSVRERAGFGGEGSFGSSADVQSPSLAGLGPTGFYTASNQIGSVSARAGSRLGPMFSNRSSQDVQRLTDDTHTRTGDPVDDEFASFDRDAEHQAPQADIVGQPDHEHYRVAGGEAGSDQASSTSNQISNAQQKTMVMPDRMRWIYRDPQGNTQGPWSGLEMHDWYKAGFFSPELQVKKYEDTEYEPLAQLIRRIGNSREPFLVPQIGIPHGTAAPPGWNPGPASATGPQPPFANSFPSFGTTLTADQQNALERRKQEEQYLMARQKEHLAQQQLAQRLQIHGQHQLLPHQVPHAQLHIQPGMASATGSYQPSPMSATKQSFYDAGLQSRGGFGGHNVAREQFGHGPEDDVFHRFDDRFGGASAPEQHAPSDGQMTHAQQIKTMADDRERLQAEQAQFDRRQQIYNDAPATGERLQEFQTLSGMPGDSNGHLVSDDQAQSTRTNAQEQSLTEQVQQAVSAQQSPSAQSPWAKIENNLAHTASPASPLPAPAAQRNRQYVADSLNAESRSRSQTGSMDANNATLAPWAKETLEASRGPSLKEIQEAEAKTAAKAEALAAEARRSAMEREMLMHAQNAAAAASTVGLPSSSTWAKEPAVSTTISPTPWTKSTKPAPGPATAKSMAQIQKEEEARKKRIAAVTLAAQQQAVAISGAATAGKRYAELASKSTSAIASPMAQSSGSWTTVAAGGKVKPPVVAAAVMPVRPVLATAPSTKKVVQAAKASPALTASTNAREEVTKWAINMLKDDLAGVTGKLQIYG